jgi:hypothetical protein
MTDSDGGDGAAREERPPDDPAGKARRESVLRRRARRWIFIAGLAGAVLVALLFRLLAQ